jgi:hypothetical protein
MPGQQATARAALKQSRRRSVFGATRSIPVIVITKTLAFSHPDYTVGSGVSPNQR